MFNCPKPIQSNAICSCDITDMISYIITSVCEMCLTSGRNQNYQTEIFKFYIEMYKVCDNCQTVNIASHLRDHCVCFSPVLHSPDEQSPPSPPRPLHSTPAPAVTTPVEAKTRGEWHWQRKKIRIISEIWHQHFLRLSQLAMRRRATSSRRWHQSPRSRSHTQRRADVGSRSQAAQSATLPLQRGLGQWTQSVLASSLDRRQGHPRQMAEIRKLRVNLQLLKSK